MRSDNGPPFASTGAAGLTRLSVWWLQLGIRLERIDPGEPQQNGRLERAHLTLEEIVSTPARDAVAQQRHLDHAGIGASSTSLTLSSENTSNWSA